MEVNYRDDGGQKTNPQPDVSVIVLLREVQVQISAFNALR